MKTLLYAEDREDDIFFLRRAVRRAGLETSLRLCAVGDGQRAIDYLGGAGDFADRALHPRPDLVLLDLKMPRKSGIEVLEWIRAQPEIASLPVFLLTSSNQQTDIQRTAALRANGYFIKPGCIGDLTAMVIKLAEFIGLRPAGAVADFRPA